MFSCDEEQDAAQSSAETTVEGTTTVEEATTTEETDYGYSVEESEWASLFTGTNLTFYTVDSRTNAQTNQKHQYDGDKIHHHTVYTGYNQTIDTFFEFVPEGESKVCYKYGQGAEGNWIKELDQYGQGESIIASLDMYFYSFADQYSSFEYDARNKQYTAESITVAYMGRTFVFTDICIKLEGGKLSEITYTYSNENGVAEFKINNVGTTSVTLPTSTVTE